MTTDLEALKQEMLRLGRAARAASEILAQTPTDAKVAALKAAAAAVRTAGPEILAANREDVEKAQGRGLSGPML